MDTYGHVTGIATATETVVNTDTNTTYSAGNGLSLWNNILNVTSYSGSFTASGNITAYSDERLKENVQTIEGALDKVAQMRGVTYNYAVSYMTYNNGGTGVIAQEIQQVMPEVVEEGEYLSVAYGNLVGVLIAAVKELKEKVDKCKYNIKCE